MPPLPTFDSETTTLLSSARRHETDLAEYQIPRLRDCPGPLALQQKFAAELREDIELFAREVEGLDVLVGDQRGERNREELRRVVGELKGVLGRLRKDYRAAILTSKRAIDMSSMSNRSELLSSSAVKERQTLDEQVTEDAVMKANNDVTEALHRTLGLMQGELERSVLATQVLETSTSTLVSTSKTHDILTTSMATSKNLITALEKADWIDRMIVFFGLAVFGLVTLWILKQRVLDRSVRVAFWWTRFLPDFSGDAELLKQDMSTSMSSSGDEIVAAVTTAVVSAAEVVSTALKTSLAEMVSSETSSLAPTASESISSLTDTSESLSIGDREEL